MCSAVDFSWSIMSEKKRQCAKRCLFGRPDREQLTLDLERQENVFREVENETFRNRWGFDPETGPIEGGPYDYEIIAVDTLPAFYSKAYKSKPARLMRNSNRSFDDGKKFISAKRKLDLGDECDGNDGLCENGGVLNKRKFENRTLAVDSKFKSLSIPAISESGVGVCDSFHEPSSHGLTRSLSAPSFPELSSTTRNKDMLTPSRPRSLQQSSLKDFLVIKKQRKHIVPRK